MKYIHKPTEVEAIRYRGGNQSIEEVLDFTGKFGVKNDIVSIRKDALYIKNPNGELVVNIGDYIIKGEKEGDYWTCASDVFEKSYEVKEGKVPFGFVQGQRLFETGTYGYICPHCNAVYAPMCLPDDEMCVFCHKDMRVKE